MSNILGVMVSSTFTDLEQHRAAVIRAIEGQGLHAFAMENDSAKPVDLVTSSFDMVHKSAAYVGIVTHRYGQIPTENNPEQLSITELEFNKAQERKLPTLIFIMGDEHPITKADIEKDAIREAKLDTFRERAKSGRIYVQFSSFEDFRAKAIQSIAELRRHLEANHPGLPEAEPTSHRKDFIPKPPALYAEPTYIGSHQFIGRQAQLDSLNDWSIPADSHPVMFLDAIGGAGKSMLTWHWLNQSAPTIRSDWAGRFWYSFYEGGAQMADFCRHALAYFTAEPLDDFKKRNTPQLSKLLLHHLQTKPCLLVLDGIERILVAYNRYDAAQLADEQASQPTDEISDRNPTSAIRPEDDDLLHCLATASPSKIIITSRLVPHVFLNRSGQPIPGILRLPLPGLRPVDAEALIRSCGVSGNPYEMRTYLKSHCDCHPLVIGALAGIINTYLPDRGSFDAWKADSGQLRIADLDLVQKRNHILTKAIKGAPESSRRILSVLAVLSSSVEYKTLQALTKQSLTRSELTEAIRDLESRGLLQYEAKRYDLHPVVRATVNQGLLPYDGNQVRKQVVDHFSSRSQNPYQLAETLDDVGDGLQIVRSLLGMGDFRRACKVCREDLFVPLLRNLEGYAEILFLLKPFFTSGWATVPDTVPYTDATYLSNAAGLALDNIGDSKSSRAAFTGALESHLQARNWSAVLTVLLNLSESYLAKNQLAESAAANTLCERLLAARVDPGLRFCFLVDRFAQYSVTGRWEEAQDLWRQLDPLGRNWSAATYNPGCAEYWYAAFQFYRGKLLEKHLSNAEQIARSGKNRYDTRRILSLRGDWCLEQAHWALAADAFAEAVSMARSIGRTDAPAEAKLALSRFQLGRLPDPHYEINRLESLKERAHLQIAQLCFTIGDLERSKTHAVDAYAFAWANGEPYVARYDLNKSRDLINKLAVPIPKLQNYSRATRKHFSWEPAVEAAIAEIRAENEASERQLAQRAGSGQSE